MVAGAMCRMVEGGGYGELTASEETRGGRERQRCPGDSSAHPRRVRRLGADGEARDQRRRCGDGSARVGEDEDGTADLGDPPDDCLDHDGEGSEAHLLPRPDLLGGLSNGGDSSASSARARAWRANGGERERAGALLSPVFWQVPDQAYSEEMATRWQPSRSQPDRS